ncbi:BES15S03c [Trypanosoma theileri]|uniref:BES15S03c n=1 Tax=Trypanosoma theileri TaxID=67003 RepID=A0A1X0NUJ9_9TRYP|nr:BES15S03c [Trypanosoma theileri]ORC88352.1 BES15S03c [Trypanosoma theileri]
MQQRDQPRRVGAELYPRRSWGTCRRAISSITRTRLLLSGDVEENPSPSLRGLQWNSAGLTQLIGADANAHALAWNRAIPPDTRDCHNVTSSHSIYSKTSPVCLQYV